MRMEDSSEHSIILRIRMMENADPQLKCRPQLKYRPHIKCRPQHKRRTQLKYRPQLKCWPQLKCKLQLKCLPQLNDRPQLKFRSLKIIIHLQIRNCFILSVHFKCILALIYLLVFVELWLQMYMMSTTSNLRIVIAWHHFCVNPIVSNNTYLWRFLSGFVLFLPVSFHYM